MKKLAVVLFVFALLVAAVPAAFGQNTQTSVYADKSYDSDKPANRLCHDSDNGKDFWNRGVTKTLESSKEDHCDGTILYEYYCDADQIQQTRYACEIDCRKGECVRNLPQPEPVDQKEPVNQKREYANTPPYPVLPSDDSSEKISEKSLLERIIKLEQRVTELEALVQKLTSCCERPTIIPQPVPTTQDKCAEQCGDVKYQCYSGCKEKSGGSEKEFRSCVESCYPDVMRCYTDCGGEKGERQEKKEKKFREEKEFPCARECTKDAVACKDDCRSQYADLEKQANAEFPRKMGSCFQERCEPKMKECLRGCEQGEGLSKGNLPTIAPPSMPREPFEAPAQQPQDDEQDKDQEAAMKRRRNFFEWLFRR